MQLSLQMILGWLSELLGWASIMGAMGLAAHTLGLRMPSAARIGNLPALRRLTGMIARYRIAGERAAAAPTSEASVPRLAGLAPVDASIDAHRLEVATYFHVRAMEELEAADDALCTLIASLAPVMTLTGMAPADGAATASRLDEPMVA